MAAPISAASRTRALPLIVRATARSSRRPRTRGERRTRRRQVAAPRTPPNNEDPDMTNATSLGAILLALGLLLAAADARADGRSLRYRATFSGSDHPTETDTNADGEKARFAISQGRSSLGSFTTLNWGEVLPWDGSSFCSATEIQLQSRFFELTQTFSDGSRLFFELASGRVCVDVTTGAIAVELGLQVVGGSGRFAGASGQTTVEARVDRSFPNGLGAFSGTSAGTIVVP
jgi:hypothetical protein